ncbi:MAG: hypothetical protein HC769_22090 [Cyanobacteria bacterium CRU_2_1]|nr:hypothetical protein [Cyanobacteria bacterium RU_5_0]NJR61281.1 hypothetical protein [Cyanobacteria bacterium CRU_2_1]
MVLQTNGIQKKATRPSDYAAVSGLKNDRSASLDSPLRLSAKNRPRASEPGGTLPTARSLGTLPGKRAARNTVSKRDTDIFSLTLNDLGNVTVTVKNLSKVNLFASFLDNRGRVLSYEGNRQFTSLNPGEELKTTYEGIAAGTYYLRFQSRDNGNNAYKLTLSASNTFPAVPDCGCGI